MLPLSPPKGCLETLMCCFSMAQKCNFVHHSVNSTGPKSKTYQALRGLCHSWATCIPCGVKCGWFVYYSCWLSLCFLQSIYWICHCVDVLMIRQVQVVLFSQLKWRKSELITCSKLISNVVVMLKWFVASVDIHIEVLVVSLLQHLCI